MSFFQALLGGGKKPSDPAPLPPTPKPNADNTSADVSSAATPGPGRAANIVAGNDPSLEDSTDPYSVKKKLLGA